MSFKMRCSVEGSLPKRHEVRVGCDRFYFENERDAIAAYKALSKARVKGGFTYEHEDEFGVVHTDNEYGLKPELCETQLSFTECGTQDEILAQLRWREIVKCDGVGECSCWNSWDLGSQPEGTQEYQDKDGVTRHMCPKCQDKELKLDPPKQRC